MSQTRICCRRCRARIAVERGIVSKRLQVTADGEIIASGPRGVTVRCRFCGLRQIVYNGKR